MRQATEAAWEKERAACWPAVGKPIADRRSGLLSDLKLDGPVGFLLKQ